MEPFALLFWLSALHVGFRRRAGNISANLSLFVLLIKQTSWTNLQFTERLVNLVRGRECVVGLSILLVYALWRMVQYLAEPGWGPGPQCPGMVRVAGRWPARGWPISATTIACVPYLGGIEEGFIPKNRSSLLFGGQNLFNSLPRLLLCARMTRRKGLIAPGW